MQPIYPMFSRHQQGGHGFARRAAAGSDERPGRSFSLTEKPESGYNADKYCDHFWQIVSISTSPPAGSALT